MPCSKGMRSCRRGCQHRDMVQGYRCARNAYEEDRERTSLGYATEEKEYDATHGAVTFKKWLKSNKGSGEDRG